MGDISRYSFDQYFNLTKMCTMGGYILAQCNWKWPSSSPTSQHDFVDFCPTADRAHRCKSVRVRGAAGVRQSDVGLPPVRLFARTKK